MNDFREIFDRLKLYFEVKSDKKVSEKLGVNYNTVKTWSNRGKIPLDSLLKELQNETINLNWLLTGKGSMHLQEPSKTQINNSTVGIGSIQGTVTGNINISIQKHKKEVTQKEDDLLEAYRTLSNDLQDYYYHQIKADAIKEKRKNES